MEEPAKSRWVGWGGYAYFLGLDWAQDQHAIAALAPDGQKVLERQISHDAAVWQDLRQKLGELAGTDLAVGAATGETTCGRRSTCGPIAAVKPVPGRKSTTSTNARRAKATPVPCVVWASVGSRASGTSGRPTSPMTNRSTPATRSATAPGC